MASIYDPEFDEESDFEPHISASRSFILDVLTPAFVTSLETISTAVLSVEGDELNIYLHPEGELYENDNADASAGKAAKSSKATKDR